MQTESMEWTCVYCNAEGKVDYPTDWIEKPTLIICSHCLKPSAYVWCNVCGMGGQITKTSFLDSPSKWQCIECGENHELLKNFYHTKITFSPNSFSNLENLDEEPKLKKIISFWRKNFGDIFLMAVLLSIVFAITIYMEQFLKNITAPEFVQFLSPRFILLLLTLTAFYTIDKLRKPRE